MFDPGERLSKLVQMRASTDIRLGTGWIFSATASYILWTTLAALFFTGLLQRIPSFTIPVVLGSIFFDTTTWLSLLGFCASTGLAYLVFRVVDRKNKHALRMREIFSESLRRIESETRPGQLSVLLPLNSAEQDFSTLLQNTHERSAILWAMLVLIPYLGWLFLIIVLYHLSEESNVHERMERLLLEDLDRVLGATGSQRIPVDTQYLPSRNSTGFLLASLFTIGIGSIFWLYEMISSPNRHFGYHSDFEPNLLAAFARSQVARSGT